MINVYDLGGKLISTQNMNNALIQIKLPKAGIYIVTVTANDQTFTEKVFLR